MLQLLVGLIYKMSVESKNTCKVWSRFQATKKDGSIIKLRIQDLGYDKYKEAKDFFVKYLIKEEAFYRAAGISNDEEAISEYVEIIDYLYEHQQANCVACYIDDESQNSGMVGLSILSNKKSQSDEDSVDDYKPRTGKVQNLFNILKILEEIKPTKVYESFYDDIGIAVRSDHRRLGIGNEFMRLRKQICIDNNVQMTSAWMTSIGTQISAAKLDWKIFHELPVEELSRKTGLTFEVDVPTFKLMYITQD